MAKLADKYSTSSSNFQWFLLFCNFSPNVVPSDSSSILYTRLSEVCLSFFLLNNQESIDKFCQEYIVDERHTRAYLEHLLNLNCVSEIRGGNREARNEIQQGKNYSDYNWDELATSVNPLLKLKVSELDKYLECHNLSKNGKKADKALHILAHKLQDDLPEGLSVATEVDTYEESSDSKQNSEGEDQDSDIVVLF